ncbi:MAG: fliD [Brevibacillus sp.]|nr:fliD [Brevibacillus sp.]
MGIRISGLASGMDTEKIVSDLMKAQREPVNRLQRSKATYEWKRDGYREMNTLLADLQNSIKNLRLSSTFNKKTVSSENESVASAKVVGSPKFSSYSIQVNQLAKAEMPAAASFTTTGVTNSSSGIGGNSFDLTINSTTITVSSADSVDAINKKLKEANAGAGVGVEAKLVNGQIIFNSIQGTDKLLTDSTDPANPKKYFTISASASNNLGIPTAAKNSTFRTEGQDGQVVINGVTQTLKGTNTLSFDGVEFTFKQVNTGTPISVNTKTDEESVFTMIKDFVTKYNEVIAKINTKISEPRYRSYQPLLDSEVEALPEATAEKMQGMARSGILLRDPILTSGLFELRRAISSPLKVSGVNTAFDTFSEIGIGGPPTGKNAYQENGKLYIDETKLRETIRNNGDDVVKLFSNYSSNTDPATKYNETGIAQRLYTKLDDIMNKVIKEAGATGILYDESSIGKKIKQTDDDIETWEDRLKVIEDRYYKQFTAMEQAMSKSQSQGSWFAQMLGQ